MEFHNRDSNSGILLELCNLSLENSLGVFSHQPGMGTSAEEVSKCHQRPINQDTEEAPFSRAFHLQVCVCSVVQSCPTLHDPWIAAYQTTLSVGFFRQEYWSRLPFPYPEEDIPTRGSNPHLLCLLHLPVNSLTPSHLGSPFICTGLSQSFVPNFLFVILHFLKTSSP